MSFKEFQCSSARKEMNSSLQGNNLQYNLDANKVK